MKIAIVGAHGYVGSHIATQAMRRGWIVANITRSTPLDTLRDADAVVHTAGSFMVDQRYKKIVSGPVSISSLAKLASMRLGLDPPNPLQNPKSFDEINFDPVAKAAAALAPIVDVEITPTMAEATTTIRRIPFVCISASQWPLADPQYIASKRKAEQLLMSLPYLRPVLLRPGFIIPDAPQNCSQVTLRHVVSWALTAVQSGHKVSVDAVAEAACDAIEDDLVEGPIDCEVLQRMDYV